MRKILLVSLKVSGILICVIVVLWLGAVAYVNINKKAVLTEISSQLNASINGKLSIGSMEPTLLRGFPGISVELKNVTLRDTLWASHGHDLLRASDVSLSIDAVSALKGKPRIKSIVIKKGSIHIYTNSAGYSNSSIFAKKVDSKKKKPEIRVNKIRFEEVLLVFENKSKFKLFQFDVEDLKVNLNYDNSGWKAKLSTNTFVRDLAFNTSKGSFIKGKNLHAGISIRYNKEAGILSIPLQTIKLDDDEVMLGGKFMLGNQPANFELDLKVKGIIYKNALSMLSPSIASKLTVVNFKMPLDLEASITGKMKFRDTPLVVVKWEVNKNTLSTPAGEVENCSFTGVFQNEFAGGKGHNDKNSRITVYHFKGNWESIPFSVDTLYVSNLVSPVIEGRFMSGFPLAKLNAILGGKTFAFNRGNATLNLHYRGGLSPIDTNKAYVYGTVRVSDADITYLPRDLSFAKGSATVNFRGRDVFIRNVRLQGGSTVLNMEGSMLNFLSLYYTDPGKMVLDWRIQSEEIDLINFISFLGTRKKPQAVTTTKPGTPVSRMSAQLDKLMDASTVHLNLKVKKLTYYTFSARNINADVSLRESGIILNYVHVNHAGGNLIVKGAIDQRNGTNNFKVKADVKGVDVQEFFKSFQNFGQEAITDRNIRGSVFATADVAGSITDKGKMVPNSLSGFVTFDLKNGMLKDFEPFQKIGRFVFRNRDLSNVRINRLASRLDIRGDRITIHPMYIESSAINLQIDGVYGLVKGTEIDIAVPLRNPKRDELILNDSSRMERGMKGIVIHLKATDGEDGNVKIKLVGRDENRKGRRRSDIP